MSLQAGTKLGQYEVRELIGKGGMGEVYRGYDTQLKRDVALKVLPEQFSRDSERLARFRREATMLASLNHPNIAAIHRLEQSGDTVALVMEYVPGETLHERISKQGGVPLDESLEIAKQICDALEHAHEKGIIHRDLKPANIKLTAEGKVKVLDFGLAKAFASDTANDPLNSQSPTVPPGASPTIPGAILGTAAYMSPEQARGKTVDKRTDIFALGCVLYELLTGKQAFAGESVGDILASVMKTEPDWTLLPTDTPVYVRGILRRCLQKDRNDRSRDAGEIALLIRDAKSSSQSGGGPAGIHVPLEDKPVAKRWQRPAMMGVGALVLAAIVAVVVWTMKPAPPQQSVIRTAITLPPGQHLAALDQPAIAISPDGKNIVYVAAQDQSPDREQGATSASDKGPLANGRGSDAKAIQQLYLRPLDSNEAKPIAGTEGAVSPFFSPDGQWIGFFAGGKLKKVSVNGGAAVTLASAPNPGGASWSSQETLALQPINAGQVLQQVPQEGGALQPLTRLAKGDIYHRWPEFLPDGQGVLFAGAPTSTGWNNAQIEVQPIRAATVSERPSSEIAERRNLAQGTQPRYAASGHLLYAQSGTLMAAPFDARRLALSGAAVPAIEGLMQSNNTGAAQYSVSSTGTLVYLAGGGASSQNRLVWVSRPSTGSGPRAESRGNGEEQSLPAVPHNYQYPRVSPDGSRVAVMITEQEQQVWVYDVSGDTLTRLTFEGNLNGVPAWSSDGTRIAYLSNRAGPQNLFWQPADGSGAAERLTTSDYQNTSASLSPDGQLLAYIETTPQTGRDIWVLNLKERKAQPFLKTPYEDTAPKFSPDGKWLVYSSDESGRREIYVQPYPGPGGKWQLSTDGGQEPVWNPKGGELFYRSGSKIMAVEVNQSRDREGAGSSSGFSAGKPKMLFDGPYLPTAASLPYYDVSPDGNRFLMLKPVESQATAPTQINVVLNWFEELKKKVPVK